MNNADDIRINRKRVVYDGYLKVEEYKLIHRQFDGNWMPEISREIIRRGAAVAVVLYDPHRDAIVFIEQFRIAAYVNGEPAWLTEIVAGLIEPGEDPAEVARRETREEAGCEILALEPMYSYVVSPGCMDETVTMFCGQVDSTTAGGHFGLPHEGEDIRVAVKPFEDAWNELHAGGGPGGGLNNSITVIALLWLKLNREALRRRWAAAKP